MSYVQENCFVFPLRSTWLLLTLSMSLRDSGEVNMRQTSCNGNGSVPCKRAEVHFTKSTVDFLVFFLFICYIELTVRTPPSIKICVNAANLVSSLSPALGQRKAT